MRCLTQVEIEDSGKIIDKSLIPNFGSLCSHCYHTFAKSRD